MTYSPANFDPAKVKIARKRFSVTQGETLIEYNGNHINQYDDTPSLGTDGNWHQMSDVFWVGVAMREAISRGMVA